MLKCPRSCTRRSSPSVPRVAYARHHYTLSDQEGGWLQGKPASTGYFNLLSLSLSLVSAAWARPFLPENIAQMLLWLARICDWSRFPQNLSRLVCWPLKVLARGEIFSVTLFTGRRRGRRNPRFGSEVAFCRRVSTLTRIVRQLAFSLGNCEQEITFHCARITFRDYKRKHARRYNEKVKSLKNIREIRMSSLVCWKVGNGGKL